MRRNIWILAILLVLIIGTIIILSLHSNKSTPTSPGILKNGIVKSVSPVDQAQSVGIFTPISITFNRALTATEQASVDIVINPKFATETKWSTNGAVVQASPTSPLLSNQKYSVTVNLGNETYSWEFQTTIAENTSPEDQNKAQEGADQNFAKWNQDLQDNYPWIDKLPIQETNYFVYFDTDKKQFIGKLYPQKNSNTSIENQTAQFKSEIQTKLKNLGVSIENYQFEWIVKPE